MATVADDDGMTFADDGDGCMNYKARGQQRYGAASHGILDNGRVLGESWWGAAVDNQGRHMRFQV